MRVPLITIEIREHVHTAPLKVTGHDPDPRVVGPQVKRLQAAFPKASINVWRRRADTSFQIPLEDLTGWDDLQTRSRDAAVAWKEAGYPETGPTREARDAALLAIEDARDRLHGRADQRRQEREHKALQDAHRALVAAASALVDATTFKPDDLISAPAPEMKALMAALEGALAR